MVIKTIPPPSSQGTATLAALQRENALLRYSLAVVAGVNRRRRNELKALRQIADHLMQEDTYDKCCVCHNYDDPARERYEIVREPRLGDDWERWLLDRRLPAFDKFQQVVKATQSQLLMRWLPRTTFSAIDLICQFAAPRIYNPSGHMGPVEYRSYSDETFMPCHGCHKLFCNRCRAYCWNDECYECHPKCIACVSEWCATHGPPKCIAATKRGKGPRCTREPTDDSDFCAQHKSSLDPVRVHPDS